MKKRSLFIVLLLSALMICVCGLTAFADGHTHQWQAKNPDDPTGVAFRCADTSCEYYYKKNVNGYNRIYMDATDGYSGVPYNADNILLTYESEDLPDEVTLSDPVYFKKGEETPLNDPPEDEGEYTAKITLLIDGKETVSMLDDFTIEQFRISADKEYCAGEDVTPQYFWLGKNIRTQETLEDGMIITCEYKSLDNAKAEYTDETPVNAGHYRVRAILYKYSGDGEDFEIVAAGVATHDFEIRKITEEDLGDLVFFVKDTDAMKEIDPEVLKCKDLNELRELCLKLEYDKDYINYLRHYYPESSAAYECPTYGQPAFAFLHINNTILYSSDLYGRMTITYKSTKKIGNKTVEVPCIFVQGVTKLNAGETELTFTIQKSRNNDKIEKKLMIKYAPADLEWIEKPEAKDDLVFNDTYQQLIYPGKVKNGTVYYAHGNGDDWSTSIPTAKDAGEHKVRYKVVPDNDNYNGIDEDVLTVNIAEAKGEDADDDEDEFDFLAPGQVKQVKVVKVTKKSAVIKFRRVSDAESYEYVITNKKGKTVKKGTVNQDITTFLKEKVTDLEKNTKYKVKVRAVTTEVVDKETVTHYGDWSKTVSFKTKKK
jgi:hypothetical protein